MKTLVITALPLALFVLCAARLGSPEVIEKQLAIPADITVCSSSAGVVAPGADGKYIPLLPGWGDLNYKITTTSDSAQYYFNQGLSFYYGYHFTESLASFKEAARFDAASPMIYWGQALSMGPFYNTYVYKMRKEVPEAVAEMTRLAQSVSAKERDLIHAMQKRYSTDMTNADRKQLDQAYASSLSALMQKYPDDSNIKALYVDAVMLQHKWDFYSTAGEPRTWTPGLVSLCEEILQKEQHPAFLHYYIHLTEASRKPGQALKAADALKDKNPGIGHMVHMSSHMYQRNGYFSKGVAINDEANRVNNTVDDQASTLKLGKDKSTHFFAVQSFCAMSAGMYAKGLPIYNRARRRQLDLAPDMKADLYAQFVYMMPVMARARLGKWDEVLSSPAVEESWTYGFVLDQFAKGVAYVRKNDIRSAEAALKKIDAVLGDSTLNIRIMPFNSPGQSCRIASSILKGEILFAGGDRKGAIRSFKVAIDEEDKMIYREPHDWLIPARQFLGAALLRDKQAEAAAKIYQEDLEDNPNNGWALVGLYNSMNALKKTAEAKAFKAQYEKAFENADVKVTASVF